MTATAMSYPDRKAERVESTTVKDRQELERAQVEAAKEFDKFDRLFEDFRKMDARLILVPRK